MDISNYTAKALKTEADMVKMAMEIGSGNLTDVAVFTRFATFSYACGFRAKEAKANAMPDGAKLFTAFNTAFRDASNGHRDPLAESSIKSWISGFGAFIEAGFWKAYDMTQYADDVIEKTKGPFNSRGAKLRKLMEEHKEKEPTAEEWAAILTPTPKTDDNPLKSLATRWEGVVSDKRIEKNDPLAMAQANANPRQRLALMAVQDAVKALKESCDVSAASTGLSRADEIALLKAKLAASNGTPTQPTN
jgi:hypothetical protein